VSGFTNHDGYNTHLLELYENRLNAIMQEELIKIGSRKKEIGAY
jgi:hypothetical protein